MLPISQQTSARQLIMFALLCCVLCSGSRRTEAHSRLPIVHVGAECIARQDRIILGDLAEIVAADPGTAERLRSITLGYAPEVGALREISKEKIALAIAAAGFVAGTVEIDAPSLVLIRREAQVVNPSLLQEAVERATLPALQAKGATARLIRLDLARLEVRTGAVEVRASTSGVRNLFAPFTVFLEVWVDSRLVRRLSTTAQVEASAPVLVAASDLAEKTRLRVTDVALEVRKLDRDPASYLGDPRQLTGVSLTRSFTRGEPITIETLVPEVVVKPGDAVRIVGESGGLKIQVAGEARAAGRVGDRIQVKNLQSGMLFQAIVVDEGLVKVRF
jgi:flagella basal body P-ring formation protein FlgA